MLILFLILMMGGQWVYAEDDGAAMETFFNEEQERIKTIKLLNLEVEKASLEFKKQEIQSKMAELNHGASAVLAPVSATGQEQGVPKPVFKVMGLTVSGKFKQALIQADGVLYAVSPGGSFGAGHQVKSIDADKVVVQKSDGTQEEIVFNGA